MSRSKINGVKIIVKPATDNAFREGYVKVNGKVIPFEVPIIVSENDVKTIERMKEPKRVDDNGINVREIMNNLKIPQEKANRIAREGNMEKAKIRFVSKYNVQRI